MYSDPVPGHLTAHPACGPLQCEPVCKLPEQTEGCNDPLCAGHQATHRPTALGQQAEQAGDRGRAEAAGQGSGLGAGQGGEL